MRILITSPTYPPFNSGLGNAVARQASSLARAGHEIVVATSGSERRTKEDVSGVRVETFVLRGAGSLIQPIRGDVSSYLDFLRSDSCDVVLLNAWQNWATDLALDNLNDISGRKYVFSHCISTNVFFQQQPLRSLIRYLLWRPYWWRMSHFLKALDGIIFLADAGSDSRFDDLRLAKKMHIPYRIVPNSISSAAALLLDHEVYSYAVRDRLISVGSYNWQKGFDFVIQAYASSRACNKIPLHLFGQEYTHLTCKLRSLAIAMGVEDDFIFLHESVSGNQLVKEYSQAKIVLSGSHTECQPLVLLDAMATGTPFVARSTGCIDRLPGGNAVSNFNEMSACIDELLENTIKWKKLAEAGRQAARLIYHPDRAERLLLEAFESMHKNKIFNSNKVTKQILKS
jgi:1,2-diacylglycerol 3-alpha-glucosyltransferase